MEYYKCFYGFPQYILGFFIRLFICAIESIICISKHYTYQACRLAALLLIFLLIGVIWSCGISWFLWDSVTILVDSICGRVTFSFAKQTCSGLSWYFCYGEAALSISVIFYMLLFLLCSAEGCGFPFIRLAYCVAFSSVSLWFISLRISWCFVTLLLLTSSVFDGCSGTFNMLHASLGY